MDKQKKIQNKINQRLKMSDIVSQKVQLYNDRSKSDYIEFNEKTESNLFMKNIEYLKLRTENKEKELEKIRQTHLYKNVTNENQEVVKYYATYVE